MILTSINRVRPYFASYPLAHKKKITLEQLAREPLLMREKGSGTRNAIERRFAGHGLAIRLRLELGSDEAQAGISVLSRYAPTLNQPDPFAVLDVVGFPILCHWYAMYPAELQLSGVARAFLDYLLGRGMLRLLRRASKNSALARKATRTKVGLAA